MIIAKTPYRISLFGGMTDYPEFYLKDGGGIVIGTAINYYSYIACSRMLYNYTHQIHLVYSKEERCNHYSEVQHNIIRSVLAHLHENGPISITHATDLPGGTGLGSSSVFTVGLLNALFTLYGQRPNPAVLAQQSIFVERELLNETVGHQDQYWAAYGGSKVIRFTTEGPEIENIFQNNTEAALFFNNLFLVNTNIPRKSTEIAATCSFNTTSKLNTIKQIAETALTYLRGFQFEYVAQLMHESWLEKRSLSNSISSAYIDELYEHGLKNGSLGGKLIGAGGGGFLLFYVPVEKRFDFIDAMKPNVVIPVSVSNEGSKIVPL